MQTDVLSAAMGKRVLSSMLAGKGAPDAIVDAEGLRQVTDAGAVQPLVEAVLAEFPARVEAYRGGRRGLLGFFIGQVIRRSGGAADPKLARTLLEAALAEP